MIFDRYHLTIANDANSFVLTYELASHHAAQAWAHIMNSLSVGSLRENFNPWHGLQVSPDDKINRLHELIDLLNEWLPDKIQDRWDYNDPQSSLNKLHIHFPEQLNNETDITKLKQLVEYNDTIHELEDIIRSSQYKLIWILLLPKSDETIELHDSDYIHFKPQREFGELCLHYPHVGRHVLELVKSRDYSCPKDQIVTQTKISAYHSLRFYDDPISEDRYKLGLINFYYRSKLKELIEINDPKLAYGYLPIGKLVALDGETIDREKVLSVIHETNRIVCWKFD